MGALPKQRISTGRKGRRRSAIKLKKRLLALCPECGQAKFPHTACPHCGFYKKRRVFSSQKEKTEKAGKNKIASQKRKKPDENRA